MKPRLWPVRVGLALVVAVYLTYSSFGVAGPFLWGHHGYHGGTYMLRAKMSIRFKMFTPATAPGFEPPAQNTYYFHHPMGYHHALDLPIIVFGDKEWVGRGVALLGGLFTLWALFALARRHWSREAGLLAVAVWVGLPIVCSFSVLVDPMLPAMACSLAVADRFLRYLERPNRRDLIAACAFTALGGFLMWEAYFQAVFHALTILVGAVFYRRHGLRLKTALQWSFATGAAAALMMGFHLGYMIWNGYWQDFLTSYGQRHEAAFAYAADRHKQWLEVLYGWPIIALGLFWLLLFLFRWFAGRARRRDLGVLIFFWINTLYIFLFPSASAIHLYRVFWYSSFFSLAIMDLTVELRHAIGRFLPASVGLVAATAAALGFFVIELPHSYANLIESRETMGTHGQPSYNPDYSKQLFAMEVARRTGPLDYVFTHSSLPRRVEFVYYADRSGLDIWSLGQLATLVPQHPRSVVILDADLAGAEQQAMLELLKRHPGYRYDHFLLIDLRDNHPGLREYVWDPQPANWVWRWFYSHKYPPMAPKAVNNAYSQCVHAVTEVPPPNGLPAPVEATRDEWALCNHNAAVLGGQDKLAAAFVERLRTRAPRRDVAVGEVGRVVGLRVNGRIGADLWMRLERQPTVGPLPKELVARWRLSPVAVDSATVKPGRPVIAPTLSGESPLGGTAIWAMTPRHVGYLYLDAIRWSVPPGRYRLTWELGLPTPPRALAVASPVRALPGVPTIPGSPIAVIPPIPASAVTPLTDRGRKVAPQAAGAGRFGNVAKLPAWHPPMVEAEPPVVTPPPPLASADLGTIEIR